MNKLTEKEYQKLMKTATRGGPCPNPVFLEISKLKTGEKLYVKKKDWKNRTPFHISVNQSKYMRGSTLHGQKMKVTTVKEGWIVDKL